MTTQKERREMKRVIKQIHAEKQLVNNDCFSAPPPYHNKTRQKAWQIGNQSGFQEGYNSAKRDFEIEKKKLISIDDRNRAVNDALKSMATAVDAMAHTINKLTIV